MITLTHQDFLAWLGRTDRALDLASVKNLLRTEGKSFPLPKSGIDAFDLARFLSAKWQQQEVVLITLETSIFTEAEELELYNSYIRSVVGHSPNPGEGLLFEPRTTTFTTTLAMHIIFRWDCIAGSSNQQFLEVSHDDLLCAQGFDKSFYENLSNISRRNEASA